MQFDSITEFLQMGGYGSYVWSSVIIVILLLVGLTLDSVTGKKRTLTKIKQELDRAEKIQRANKPRTTLKVYK